MYLAVFTSDSDLNLVLIAIVGQAVIDCTIVVFAMPGAWKVFKRKMSKDKSSRLTNEAPFTQSVARYCVAAALFAVKMYYIRGSGVFAERAVTNLLDSLRIIIILTVFNVGSGAILGVKSAWSEQRAITGLTENNVKDKSTREMMDLGKSNFLSSRENMQLSYEKFTRNGLNGLYGLNEPMVSTDYIPMHFHNVVVSIGSDLGEGIPLY